MTHARRKPAVNWPVGCPECGRGTIRPLAAAGRLATYKNMALPVPPDLEIPTCDNCGLEWIDPKTAASVDAALDAAFQKEAREQATTLLADLRQHVTQKRMESLLGLSHGYLSKIRSGASVPSPMLLACLKLLASDPTRRVHELEQRPPTRRSRADATERSHRPRSASRAASRRPNRQ
jgi:hypothetical protein